MSKVQYKTWLHTSRPSQNSASVICPVITNSLCKAPNSGSLKRTFLRNRNSLAGSFPAMTGVALLSLTTDVALESAGCDVVRVGRGVWAITGVVVWATVTTGLWSIPRVLLLRAIMVVNSCLNFSRSAMAIAGGLVNVKLWPVSSPMSDNFNLTKAAPSLLQKRADFYCVSHLLRQERQSTDTNMPHQHTQRVWWEPSFHLASIVGGCPLALASLAISCRTPSLCTPW